MGSARKMKYVRSAAVVALCAIVAGSPIASAVFVNWFQFQGNENHMGGTYTLNGAAVTAKGGNRCGITCEAYGSPAMWSEDLPNNQGEMQFLVWGMSECGQQGGPNGRLELNYGQFAGGGKSPWRDMGFNGNGRSWFGAANDDNTGTPAVFSLDDNSVDTTRIATLSEKEGYFRLDKIAYTQGGNPPITTANVVNEDVFFPNVPNGLPTPTYPIISPIVYTPPPWAEGPDAGANPDDYAYTPYIHYTLNANNVPKKTVAIESYDLREANGANAPRYFTQELQDREFTMSTPAILTQQTQWRIIPGAFHQDIARHPWAPNPIAGLPPVFAGPSWVNPVPTWPAGVGFALIPVTPAVYLLLVTHDLANNQYKLTAFDIDPNHLVHNNNLNRDEYPIVWDQAINDAANSAVAGSNSVLFWKPALNQLHIEPIAAMGLENGQVLIVSDVLTANPKLDYVSLDKVGMAGRVGLGNPIRSTPTFAEGHIIIPWSDHVSTTATQWPHHPNIWSNVPDDTLNIDLIDLTNANNNVPKVKFVNPIQPVNPQNVHYRLDRHYTRITSTRDTQTLVWTDAFSVLSRDLVTASGVYDNQGEAGQRHYYLGVRDPSSLGPHVGLLRMDWTYLTTPGPPGQIGFTLAPSMTAQYRTDGKDGGFTDWMLYSSPALVSENEANNKNYIGLGAQMPPQEIWWTDNQQPPQEHKAAWGQEAELFTFNS